MTATAPALRRKDAPRVASAAPGWPAQLRLRYARRREATCLVERSHAGPLFVQKALHPEGDEVCHTYLVHPPGGIVGGDQLRVDVAVEPNAHALLTTPAATRIYRSGGAAAGLDQHLRVAARGTLEWLPQETIAFDGCRADLQTRVTLEGDASFVGWELLQLGRPASRRPFRTGRLVQSIELERSGEPLLRERLDLAGDSPALAAPWGLDGHPVVGTMLVTHPDGIDPSLLDRIREQLEGHRVLAGATSVSGLLVVRVLSDHARLAARILAETWSVVRPAVLGRTAEPPRIWNT